ncbi:MAG: DUF1615 domain-containing protein [Steroidobacter sp.]
MICAVVALLSACSSSRVSEPPVDPDVVRAEISQRLPQGAKNREGWAIDIFAAFEALSIKPTKQNICAVVAVTEQESTFQVNPPVPGLPEIARREIDARAAGYNIPKMVVTAALSLRSSTGATYLQRLQQVKTEQELSVIFADFTGMVPLGERLFGDFNPVRTGGPMQVSITFAEEHAEQKRYPYPMPGTVRDEVFTRRGGMYFGIAHLLDYPVSYRDMMFRFADFNAGHYASRNAAFQNAVSKVSRKPLALDGDLLIHGSKEPSRTELAIRSISARLDMDERDIRRDLERGQEHEFEDSKLYQRVFSLAGGVPREMIPNIRLKSPKIKRKLTTEWFATRVDGRYERCLARSG